MNINHNFNDPDHITQLHKSINDLIAQMPDEITQPELAAYQQTLRVQNSVAADCHEAHLEMCYQRLQLVWARFKNGAYND